MVERKKDEAQDYSDQHPVYYLSEVFSESKQRYPHYQKLVYGVFFAVNVLDLKAEETYGELIDCPSVFGHDWALGVPSLIDLVLHEVRIAVA